MSRTTIRFEHRVDGQLVNAATVAIADGGLVRMDTRAVVVAAGTELEHKSEGVYEHTFDDPAAGLNYEYSLVWTDKEGGSFGPIEFTVAGGSGPIAAYNTLAEARALAAGLGLTKVTAATDDQLKVMLQRACSQIDARKYQGRKCDPEQARVFPRYANGRIWDLSGAAAVVPAAVREAEVLQAEYLLAGGNAERLQAIADGVTSQSIGNQSESYGAGARPELLCLEARQKLDRFRLTGGRIL